MTQEEARQIITAWLVSSKSGKGQCGYIEGWFHERDVEAFNMAIEALAKEPNEDLISRTEILIGYQSVCKDIKCQWCRAKDEDGACRLESFIKNLPSADRPKGHWVGVERLEDRPIEELSVQTQRQKGKSYLDEKFIVICEKEFETPHVNGIYDDLYSAIGHTISEITDYKKNCISTIKELEYIKVGEMESLGSGGVYFRVESKVTSNEKAFTDYWKILFYKTESEE